VAKKTKTVSKKFLIIRGLRQAVKDEKEFELMDINETLKGVPVSQMEENVIYILRRENLMPKRGSIVIPEGGYDYGVVDDEEWRFAGNFEIFDMHDILAYGSVVSTGSVFDDEIEIRDMTINITEVVGYPESQGSLRFF